MIFFVLKDGREIQAHLHDDLRKKFQAEDVVEVQAEGDELKLILSHISGIPKSQRSIQHWYGDDAKFIANFCWLDFSKDF